MKNFSLFCLCFGTESTFPKFPHSFGYAVFSPDWEYNPVEQLDILILLWELHAVTREHFWTSRVNNGNSIAPYLQMLEI